MTDRPILFSGPMVRALLDGRKTQTRRVVTGCVELPGAYSEAAWNRGEMPRCPYGEPGDRLWVRETFGLVTGNGVRVVYRADAEHPPRIGYPDDPITNMKWTPSIYMRRQHSRITLAVTSVRVERLQQITEEDAIAEGVFGDVAGAENWTARKPNPVPSTNAACRFAYLWQHINGDRPGCSWDANPWVWVVEFKREVPA